MGIGEWIMSQLGYTGQPEQPADLGELFLGKLQNPMNRGGLLNAGAALLASGGQGKSFGEGAGAAIQGYQQGENAAIAQQKALSDLQAEQEFNNVIGSMMGGQAATPGAFRGAAPAGPAATMLGAAQPAAPGGAAAVPPFGNTSATTPAASAVSGGGIGAMMMDPRFQMAMMKKNPAVAMQIYGSLLKKEQFEPKSDLGKLIFERDRYKAAGANDTVKLYDQAINKVQSSVKYKERDVPVGRGQYQKEYSNDDGASWQPLGPTHYKSNPFVERTVYNPATAQEGKETVNAWDYVPAPGPAQGSPRTGSPQGAPQAAPQPAPQGAPQTAPAGTPAPQPQPQQQPGYHAGPRWKPEVMKEKEVDDLRGNLQLVDDLNQVERGLQHISGPIAGRVNTFIAENKLEGLPIPEVAVRFAKQFGIEMTPELTEAVAATRRADANLQSIIKGIPSNYDQKIFRGMNPQPGLALEANQQRLQMTRAITQQLIAAKIADAKAMGKVVPPTVEAQAKAFGIDPSTITGDPQQYMRAAQEAIRTGAKQLGMAATPTERGAQILEQLKKTNDPAEKQKLLREWNSIKGEK
jgi:hypothetical protein